MSGRRKNTQTPPATAAAAKAKKAAAAAAAKAKKAEQDAGVRARAAALKAHLLKALRQQEADAELTSGPMSPGRDKSKTPDPPSGTIAPSQQESDEEDADGLGFELPVATSPPHFLEDEDYNGDLPPSSDVFDVGLESDDELDVADVCTLTRPRKRVASGGLSTAPIRV